MVKKILIIISSILILALVSAAAYIYYVPQPVTTVEEYIEAWQEEDYQKIYDLLTEESKGSVAVKGLKDNFENFLNQAGIEKVEVLEVKQISDDFYRSSFELEVGLESKYFADSVLNYVIHLERERLINWKIVWDYQMIYPGMQEGDSFIRKRSLAARGEIYDRNGKPLAVKDEIIIVGVHPTRIKDREKLVQSLSEILLLDLEYVDNEIDRYSNNPDWLVPIKKLTMDEYKSLETELRPIPGVVFSKSAARIYPSAGLMAHTVGYMGEVDQGWIDSYPERDYRVGDKVGKSGLERAFELELRGEPGYTLYLNSPEESDSREVIMDRPPLAGDDIYLTLDTDYQLAAYQGLGERVGSIVLIDPNTAEVLALVNYPSYDPNDFVLGMTANEWENLRDDERNPMLNRALQGTYPPGSIMKLITASAVIDSGVLESETVFTDTGEYRVKGNVIRNFQKEVFGEHKFADALTNSINTTMAKSALELGKDKFLDYTGKFSFGSEIDFPLAIRESNIGNISSPVALAWAAIGQAEVLATPLQMALVPAIIAADGRKINPYLVSKRIDYGQDGSTTKIINSKLTDIPQENSSEKGIDKKDDYSEGYSDEASDGDSKYQVIRKETAETLTSLMVSVVEEGTGKNASLPGVRTAGKTGTAEIGDPDDLTHAWFASFAPADDPELAMLIFLEKGGVGGQNAAPIAGELWTKFLDLPDLVEEPSPIMEGEEEAKKEVIEEAGKIRTMLQEFE